MIYFDQNQTGSPRWEEVLDTPGVKPPLLSLDSTKRIADVHSLSILPQPHPRATTSTTPKRDPFGQFKEFPDTLKVLDLFYVPLYPSIRKITTLTKLNFNHLIFLDTPEAILAFLGSNPLLEDVNLHVGFRKYSHFPDPKPEHQIRLDHLKSLSVQGNRPSSSKRLINLISHISLPKDARVNINTLTMAVGEMMWLDDTLSCIKDFAKPPTHLRMGYGMRTVEFPGPNESNVSVSYIIYSDMTSALTEKILPFFGKVENLTISLDYSCPDLLSFEPSLFPSLKNLTVERDPQISATLSKLLSSSNSFSLDKLNIEDCNVVEGLKERLWRFSYKYGCEVLLSERISPIIFTGSAYWQENMAQASHPMTMAL